MGRRCRASQDDLRVIARLAKLFPGREQPPPPNGRAGPACLEIISNYVVIEPRPRQTLIRVFRQPKPIISVGQWQIVYEGSLEDLVGVN